MSERGEKQQERVAEAEGSTLGEAKWAAMKLLERRFPGVTADAVTFSVVTEGDEASGQPARVAGEVDVEAWRAGADELPEEPGERVRALVTRVCAALDLRASVDIEESAD